jgi:hypothetical protein
LLVAPSSNATRVGGEWCFPEKRTGWVILAYDLDTLAIRSR